LPSSLLTAKIARSSSTTTTASSTKAKKRKWKNVKKLLAKLLLI
jgi:hypothetical protein